jgi:hypothetical protein
MTRFAFLSVIVAAGSWATACLSPSAEAATSTGQAWTDNGATACDAYLTNDVVAAILTNPPGATKKLSKQSCTYRASNGGGSISITLGSGGQAGLDQLKENMVDPVPLSGVGDKAWESVIGISAVKGPVRVCTVHTVGPPGSIKLRGAELGRKLGAICNQLFALP